MTQHRTGQTDSTGCDNAGCETTGPEPGDDRTGTHVLVVGGGDVAVAIGRLAQVLDWDCRIIQRLTETDHPDRSDAVVVLSHDVEIAGVALQRALCSGSRYVGAMGSRTTQQQRRDWLSEHQVDAADIRQIHGPAGLDIGAESPTEIALAILAEIIAEGHGAAGGSISRRPGPIHASATTAGPGSGPAECPGG